MKSRIDRPLVALIGAFFLAIVHQYLFYGNLFGVSYPIFIGLLYWYMLYNAKDQIVQSSWLGWVLFGSILLLSLTYALFQNPFFYVLNFVVIPSLFFVHMAYVLSEKRPVWYKPQVIGVALEHLIIQSLRHVPTAFRIVKPKSSSTVGERHKTVIGKVLIGLAIAMPLLMVVISLLSSADGVFDQFISRIPNVMSNFSVDKGIFRFVWVCIVCVLLFGYLWGFIDSKKYEWGHGKEPDRVDKDAAVDSFKIVLDPIITATVLIAINIVYVLFVILQFSYLFGAWEGTLPQGASYAEYARSGFFELMVVTAINFVLLMGTLVFNAKEQGLLQRINNVMLYILVVCSCVMLYSAYTRLVLYEEAYGYTYIRFLVHAFMIFLGILLIVAGLRIHFASLPLAKFYIVLGLLSYVIMNYTSMDTIIAEKNMERYKQSGSIDESYLNSLSTDATQSLIRYSLEEHGIMDEYLREQWQNLSMRDRDWPSFNLSEYRAERALEKYFLGEN
ncbi:DUF4153 domain-containing protein [Paenibacillus macquariensis]|nr:DUF4173 domain-containing protein [Paenibacillus macquariensis]MEC0089045.1 DUF4173 domain-containing protein [Paenibacillus macquariensis]OAB31971.1 hypothetical protein PMSM_18465 [Paenibacillus macquariensis subsp. macquariensis]